jgi:DNA-binding LacI/PurR family transcriptional regulator
LAGIETYVVDSDFTVQGGYFTCSKLLSMFKPEAILCAHDLTAIGALHAAHDRGVQVPAEMSVVGFDDITFAKYCQPPLTTVSMARSMIGSMAFQALWRHMENPAGGGMEYVIQPSLVVRDSCHAATGAAQDLLDGRKS